MSCEDALPSGGFFRRLTLGIPNPLGSGCVDFGLNGIGSADPLRSPIAFLQAGFPIRDFVPVRTLAVHVFDFDGPPGALAGAESLASVFNVEGLVRRDFAAVPQVADTALQILGARCDEDSVSGLTVATGFRCDDPAKSRGRFVDPDWVRKEFTTETTRRKSCKYSHGYRSRGDRKKGPRP